MIVYVVGEIRALIFDVASVLVKLIFITKRPFALEAFRCNLRAAFRAGISTTNCLKIEIICIIKISCVEATILICFGIGPWGY